jgi:hypothetical protein
MTSFAPCGSDGSSINHVSTGTQKEKDRRSIVCAALGPGGMSLSRTDKCYLEQAQADFKACKRRSAFNERTTQTTDGINF